MNWRTEVKMTSFTVLLPVVCCCGKNSDTQLSPCMPLFLFKCDQLRNRRTAVFVLKIRLLKSNKVTDGCPSCSMLQINAQSCFWLHDECFLLLRFLVLLMMRSMPDASFLYLQTQTEMWRRTSWKETKFRAQRQTATGLVYQINYMTC